MQLQSHHSPALRLAPSARPRTEPRVAILLNAHARKVSQQVVNALSHVVSQDDLFLSRSELDARRIAQVVIERGYDTVFTGGGDGTFVGFVNELLRARRGQALPRFGILKLGTGNGLAAFVNASASRGGIQEDVLRARAGELSGSRRMSLLEVDGQRAPFAGLGVDGRLLNDYLALKRRFSDGPLRSILTGAGGYASAIAFKTLPHYLTNSAWVDCEVINGEHGQAHRLGPDGMPAGAPIPPGGRLFQGRLMMAAAATMPFYGYGLKMFPHAHTRPGMMQVRLGQVGALEVLANLPKLWAGRWQHPGIQDFHAQQVTIRYTKPMALQIGGDASGYRSEVTLSVAPETVELIDFRPTAR